MIKIENVVTPSPEQWEAIVRGTRNPMNSWDKSDSYKTHIEDVETLQTAEFEFFVGENDLELMKKLAASGADHRKFMRMIVVYADITSHHTWWSEFDTYKVGTVRNSCSKMHKIHVKEFTGEDFSHEGITELGGAAEETFNLVLTTLEKLRKSFNDTGEKKYWRALIELLPMGYNLKATLMLNYEVLSNIYHSRKNHKLDEWQDFCRWVETLPHSELITGGQ